MSNPHSSGPDDWLTPPELIKALGRFDLDPCTPVRMPWRTAARRFTPRQDGLKQSWGGRVWLNPPYSDVAPWIDRFVEHGNGMALLSAKSVETRWGQKVLAAADAVLFLKGRLLFHYPSGKRSTGKWLSNMLVAIGAHNRRALVKAMRQFPGVLMEPA